MEKKNSKTSMQKKIAKVGPKSAGAMPAPVPGKMSGKKTGKVSKK